MTNPPPGAPDYFALFQSMFTPGGATPAAPASYTPPMLAMLDPKELERKIGELETVLSWLKATTGMIEMSIQTMKYQHSLLNSLADSNTPSAPPAQQPTMEELAKMAGAMNPALWAFNMMQQPDAAKTAKKAAAPVPRAPPKKPRR
jgi:hypothetical protein